MPEKNSGGRGRHLGAIDTLGVEMKIPFTLFLLSPLSPTFPSCRWPWDGGESEEGARP